MSETDLAYAAGLIDGEGYIGIVRRSPGKSGYQRGSYTLQACVTMAHEPTIRWLTETFGMSYFRKEPRQAHHSVTHLAYLHHQRACEFLRLVQPYMKTKAEQVALAIEYCEGYTVWRNTPGRPRNLPDEEIARRDAIYHQLRNLNGRKRGPQS